MNSPSADASNKISDTWKKKFALIEKAGGLDLPKESDLPLGERIRIKYNLWAFLFGPFYYLTKGMWKKAIVLTAIWIAAIVIIELFFGAASKLSAMEPFIGPIIFLVQANSDYYKKIVLGNNGWW